MANVLAAALAVFGIDAGAQTGSYAVPPSGLSNSPASMFGELPGGYGAQPAGRNAAGQVPPLQPAISVELDLTDNAKLAPANRRESDLVLQLVPSLAINEKTARTRLTGTITATALVYARTGNENNKVRPEANLLGTAELYPRLLFVDGAVIVSQQYLSPFGARPESLASATDNRYTAQSYRVSPYLKGDAKDDLHYELRDNNTWTYTSGGGAATNNSYTNEVAGNVTRDPRPFGWAVQYHREDTQFRGQQSLLTELERGQAIWQPEAQWRLLASAGYEDNRYPLAHLSGPIYGAGFKWRPTERTNVDADWEHRFFGGSYHFTFDHHTPLSVWMLHAFRDITSYPQQLANLAPGSDVSTLLNQIFISRIPDPDQRQTIVDQLISERGLPSELASPLILFTQKITLQESVQATAGLLGARNTVLVTAFRTRSEPVAGADETIDLLVQQVNNTQTGGKVVWAWKLTPLYTLLTSGDWVRTVGDGQPAGSSNQVVVRTVLSAALSPRTNVFVGARHQQLASDLRAGYRENAVFAGMIHVFR